MFGKIIFYDKKTISEYKSLITGQKQLEITEYEIVNGKGLGVDFKGVKADISADKKYTAKVADSALYDCNEFESMLEKREGEDYFDFTESDDYDINTVPKGSIVKLKTKISIPESFDLMQMLEQFKPFVVTSVQSSISNSNQQEAVSSIIRNAKATKIPVIFDSNEDILLCTKLNKDLIAIDYEDFIDNDEEAVVLARVSSSVKKAEKPFYDPLKDFMTLNRAMRKKMTSRNESINAICVDEDYRTIDVLAIYR